ncbi:AraC family transcriptional regulator [Neiella marina]|uniref:AraC family transcriptional regulator n=1 Tax=Neiella holothuriorum TaxID=2870530 RepID=A0ABS7EKG7_9GAMM|nr:AraC family transcriptional regulator [Neiella holothuriorum]MBW8192857.1 AraC family transcriptional regulator [Neiella holothuriorum]
MPTNGLLQPTTEWRDILHLHPDCEEVFVATQGDRTLQQAGVNLAGRSILKTSYRVGRATPDNHTVLLTLSGGGVLHTKHGRSIIEPDSMMVLPASQPFLFELEQQACWRTCWFLLADNERWQFLHQRQQQLVTVPGLGGQLDRTLATFAAEQQSAPSQQQALISQLVLSFLDRVLERQSELPQQQVKLMRLFDDVERQLHLPWSVADLAKRMYLSEPQLYRLSRQYIGLSPMQHITQLRVKRGKDLLFHSQLSVKQIAQSLGYEDGLSFSHCFKKHVGLSPQHWRQQQARR